MADVRFGMADLVCQLVFKLSALFMGPSEEYIHEQLHILLLLSAMLLWWSWSCWNGHGANHLVLLDKCQTMSDSVTGRLIPKARIYLVKYMIVPTYSYCYTILGF